MKLVTATLVAHKTADGLAEMLDVVPLGKKYVVDLDSLTMAELYNTEHGRWHHKRIIDADDGKWLFADLLTWAGKDAAGH